MSQAKDLVRRAPAIAITVGVLAFAFGGGVGAQESAYGCYTGVSCSMGWFQTGTCGFRSGGGSGDHCSCFASGDFRDTCDCSTGQYGCS
jgi:hypothetical protein